MFIHYCGLWQLSISEKLTFLNDVFQRHAVSESNQLGVRLAVMGLCRGRTEGIGKVGVKVEKF
jgi:hypothetical protein